MLTDGYSDPLDLDDELDGADDDRVIALLETALADPRASGDVSYQEYLDRLTDAYTASGRARDGIATYERLARFNPTNANMLTVARAGLLVKVGESEAAINLLERLHSDELARPPADRDFVALGAASIVAFPLARGAMLADTLGREALALAKQFSPERVIFYEVMFGDGPLAISRRFPPRAGIAR